MGLTLTVLASGSLGNATLVSFGDGDHCTGHALIDCGLSPRATAARLEPLGLTLEDLDAIMLTHLDGDHFAPGWVKPIRRLGLRVHLHERHRARATRHGMPGRLMFPFRSPFTLSGDVEVEPVMLQHDALGTVGFVIDRAGTRLGFATDLGHVPMTLLERFTGLHAVCIESNYDRARQRESDRPEFLKRRIMSGGGHLSNEEALTAVLDVEKRSHLAHVVLLHLSRECNDPRLVRRLYARRAPHLVDRLTIAAQHENSPTLRIKARGGRSFVGEQMVFEGRG
jgi:phosphoribosyl 1,2-cyclic phosphodiesterase